MKFRAKHILVEQKYEIEDIQKKLDSGISFEELARDYSLCGSAKDGGDLGEFSKGMMVKSFEDALIRLKADEISGPVQTQFGYHLILRVK